LVKNCKQKKTTNKKSRRFKLKKKDEWSQFIFLLLTVCFIGGGYFIYRAFSHQVEAVIYDDGSKEQIEKPNRLPKGHIDHILKPHNEVEDQDKDDNEDDSDEPFVEPAVVKNPPIGKKQGSMLDFISNEYQTLLKWECNKLGVKQGILFCEKPNTYLKYNDEFNVMGLTSKANPECHEEFYRVLFNTKNRKVEKTGEQIIRECYYRKYFNEFKDLPKCIRGIVFDAGVLSGTHRAKKFLQKVLGVKVDGVLGPITKAKYSEVNKDTLNSFYNQFLSYLKTTKVKVKGETKSLWDKYKNGWTNRLNYVNKKSEAYCGKI